MGLLLWGTQRWPRGTAVLLAGLPTVTGPAMVWLALDGGPHFAGEAAHGAVAAAVPCALFAWACACLVAARCRAGALAGACVAGGFAALLQGGATSAWLRWRQRLALARVGL